jgi:uncharacterized membrane protein YdbT with pleckstrin-like domain
VAEDDLIPGETMLMRVHRHPIMLVSRCWLATVIGLALAIAMAVLVPHTAGGIKWVLVAGVLLVLFVYLDAQWIIWRSETFTITDQRVILRRGVIGSFTRSIGLNRVQDVSTRQGLLGRMLGYGTIEIEAAGKDGSEVFEHLPNPQQFRNVLFERIQPGAHPGSW